MPFCLSAIWLAMCWGTTISVQNSTEPGWVAGTHHKLPQLVCAYCSVHSDSM